MRLTKKFDVYGHKSDLSFLCEEGKDYFKKERKLGLYLKIPWVDVTLTIHLNKYNLFHLEDMVNHYFRFLDNKINRDDMIKKALIEKGFYDDPKNQRYLVQQPLSD